MPVMGDAPRNPRATRVPSATTGVGAEGPGVRRIELPVTGLTCQNCVQSLESALRAVPGVARATVNLATERAGDPVSAVLTAAPGGGQPIGGVKVITEHGWCAARPSGTEAVFKLYAESFKGPDHLRRIQEEAQAAIQNLFLTKAVR